MSLSIGVDIGSTTIKGCVFEGSKVIYENYERHHFDVEKSLKDFFANAESMIKNKFFTICLTGSAGMQVADALNLPFLQEVVASTLSVRKLLPQVDVVLEIGGEDGKICFLNSNVEKKKEVKCTDGNGFVCEGNCGCSSAPAMPQVSIDARMNTLCAGGTGAFIDQMAVLLETDAAGLNVYAQSFKEIFPIASRCGVFAKADVQPLLNEGASKSDIAASILQAVVNQTVSGLACGRPIKGRVAFLGGPLHFLDQLQCRFKDTLKLSEEDALFPENGHFFVAYGAALHSQKQIGLPYAFLKTRLALMGPKLKQATYRLLCSPLFGDNVDNERDRVRGDGGDDGRFTRNESSSSGNDGSSSGSDSSNPNNDGSAAELASFRARHAAHAVRRGDIGKLPSKSPLFLGVDSGSTTIKCALIGVDGSLLWTHYASHYGNTLKAATEMFQAMYAALPDTVYIAKSVVTGYGENLIKAAFRVDEGCVETVCHLKAAQAFLPGVDFVLDIGGQDMKSMKVSKTGTITQICLNEACSSGCGSFLQTLAGNLDLTLDEFSQKGLRSKAPVDLGSRCTVFMNSRIKQAQKDCATVEDISAGLALSVVKNALFKVIRVVDPANLGEHIVVQGGIFFNDAVLRAAEIVFGREVVRPDISGLMGCYGAALLALEHTQMVDVHSSVLSREDVALLEWETATRRCGKCVNNCQLTIHKFSHTADVEHVSGNRCQNGLPPSQRRKRQEERMPNVATYHGERVFSARIYTPLTPAAAYMGTVGFPRALLCWEEYPLWFTAFSKLGFRVLLSRQSDSSMAELGKNTVHSEAACFPTKIVHGHILDLIAKKVNYIYMPMGLYGQKEDPRAGQGMRCPLLTTYGEMIRNSFDLEGSSIKMLTFPVPLFDQAKACARFAEEMHCLFPPISGDAAAAALKGGFAAFERFIADLRVQGEEAIRIARERKKPIAVLAGYSYQLDPIHSGVVTTLLSEEGYAIVTAESICHLGQKVIKPYEVRDMYTADTRIMNACKYAATQSDMVFVHLSSFGCSITPSTHDQCESFMRVENGCYCNIKIDQAHNLGAIRVRIRSLIAAHQQKGWQVTDGVSSLFVSSSPFFSSNALSSPSSFSSSSSCSSSSVVSSQLPSSPSLSPALQGLRWRNLFSTSFFSWTSLCSLLFPRFSSSSNTHNVHSSSSLSSSPSQSTLVNEHRLLDIKIPQGLWLIPKKPNICFIQDFSKEHGEGFCAAVNSEGWDLRTLPDFTQQEIVECGLRFVSADCCYSTLLAVGSIILALQKGVSDPNHTSYCAIHMGGSCSAPTLSHLVQRGLIKAGYGQVKVVELNFDYYTFPKMSGAVMMKVKLSFFLNDLLTRLRNRCTPYEKVRGSTTTLWEKWRAKVLEHIQHTWLFNTKLFMKKLVEAFEALPLTTEKHTKPRVGIVGLMCRTDAESYDYLKRFLCEEEGCEIFLADLYGWAAMASENAIYNYKAYSFPLVLKLAGQGMTMLLDRFLGWCNYALKGSKRFEAIDSLSSVLERTYSLIGPSNTSGEGWYYTAQMLRAIDLGVRNFVCLTSFNCLPVHLACRGVIPRLKALYPDLNIAIVDLDSGNSRLNVVNRLRLMLNSIPEREMTGLKQTLCRIEDFFTVKEIGKIVENNREMEESVGCGTSEGMGMAMVQSARGSSRGEKMSKHLGDVEDMYEDCGKRMTMCSSCLSHDSCAVLKEVVQNAEIM